MKKDVTILDDNGYRWHWDGEWLDIVYDAGETPEPGSGYPADSYDEVLDILYDGGFIARPNSYAVQVTRDVAEVYGESMDFGEDG